MPLVPGWCPSLVEFPYVGPQTCEPLGEYERFYTNELVTLYGSTPASVCAYESPVFGTCGELSANNAFYCPADGSVSWHRPFLGEMSAGHGPFAAATIIAHEWGHLNQHYAGLIGPHRAPKQNELNADCQAGVFAAIQHARGFAAFDNPQSAFSALCSIGDPHWTWFDPTGHGTCEQRTTAFNWGFQYGLQWSSYICSGWAFQATMSICSVY